MSFDATLADWSRNIRRWAVVRLFQDEGYYVEWESSDAKHWKDINASPLTLDRYKKGRDHDGLKWYVPQDGAVWNYKYNELDWVDEAITQFGKSNPSRLLELIVDLHEMPGKLCADPQWLLTKAVAKDGLPTMKVFDRVADIPGASILLSDGLSELDNWSGYTAGVYVTTFDRDGEHWEEVVRNDYFVAEMLVAALEAQLAVFITARESIQNICRETHSALKTLDDFSDPDASDLLLIVGALGSAALTLASFGTGAAIVGSAFTITATLVNQAESGGDINSGAKGREYKIGGDTATAVLDSMKGAVSSLLGEIDGAEDRIAGDLREAYNTVLDARGKFEIMLPEDAPPMSADSIGNRSDEPVTAADKDKVRAAAEDSFPPAAGAMLSVNEILAGCSLGSGEFASEHRGGDTLVRSPWGDLKNLLQDLTGHNGDLVERAGKVLLDYAVQLGEVDADSAADIAKQYDGHEAAYSGVDHRQPPPQIPE